jgi:hypothetical protein
LGVASYIAVNISYLIERGKRGLSIERACVLPKRRRAYCPLLTHTRIGDKENDIYGGKYIVKKEDEPEFYKAIYEEVIVGSKMEYLTERQYPDGPMYVDIDMR